MKRNEFSPDYSKLDLLNLQGPEVAREFIESLSDEERINLLYDPAMVLRPKQQPPSLEHGTVLYLPGRSWGKTMTGAMIVNKWAYDHPGCRIGLIGAATHDCRDVMVRGISGIIETAHPMFKPEYISTLRLLRWPNGSQAITVSAEKPEQLRGLQFNFAWADELCKFKYADELWEQLNLYVMRLGETPQIVITTTPKPTRLLRELASDPEVLTISGSTFENGRLPERFLKKLRKTKGTRSYRQEVLGEIMDENPNAMFDQDIINNTRHYLDEGQDVINFATKLEKVVVSVDPAVTDNPKSDATGIVVAGVDASDHGYVLEDKTMKGTINSCMKAAISLYRKYDANCIVVEVNQGGTAYKEFIGLIDKSITVKEVRAKNGKTTRMEPVASLYEEKVIHHVGYLDELETQMVLWDPVENKNQKSPDRVDALVYAITHLLVKAKKETWIF